MTSFETDPTVQCTTPSEEAITISDLPGDILPTLSGSGPVVSHASASPASMVSHSSTEATLSFARDSADSEGLCLSGLPPRPPSVEKPQRKAAPRARIASVHESIEFPDPTATHRVRETSGHSFGSDDAQPLSSSMPSPLAQSGKKKSARSKSTSSMKSSVDVTPDNLFDIHKAHKEKEKKDAKKKRRDEKASYGLRADAAKLKWKWDPNRLDEDDWIFGEKAFLKRHSDGEIKYLFGDTVFQDGVFHWGLKIGNISFLYLGHVDADKFRGWHEQYLHNSSHCHCVSYAGGLFFMNGKKLGTAKRIKDGCVVWCTVDCNKGVVTLTRGKDASKVLCEFRGCPKRLVPWVGVGCANVPYELKYA